MISRKEAKYGRPEEEEEEEEEEVVVVGQQEEVVFFRIVQKRIPGGTAFSGRVLATSRPPDPDCRKAAQRAARAKRQIASFRVVGNTQVEPH